MKKLLTTCLILSITTIAYAQNVGIDVGTPLQKLDVAGAIRIGTTSTANAGAIRYVSGSPGRFEGYNGSTWVDLSYDDVDPDWTISGSDQYSGVIGNVGIGVTAPLAKLHVDGNNELFRLKGNSTNVTMARYYANSSPRYDFTTLNATGAQITLYDQNGTYASRIGAGGPTFFRFGNVGIGNDNPTAKLEVTGQVKITGGTPGSNKVLTSDANGLASWIDPATLIANDGDWTISGTNQHSAVSGNVGIGTTTPDAKLELYNAGGTTSFKITKDGTQRGELYFLNGNNGNQGTTLTLNSAEHFVVQNNYADKDIFFNINDGGTQTDVLFIDGGESRVGVLNTAPTYALDVSGDVGIDNSLVHNDDDNTFLSFTPDRIQLFAGSGSSPRIDIQASVSEVAVNEAGLQWDFRVEGDTDTDLLFVDGSADNVGIGTAAPSAKLEIAGQVKITGGVPGLNKVLVSDAVGLASWVTPTSLDLDNLGNHTATENIQLSDFYLSNDGDNEGIRIDDAGNVGIGTDAPSQKFHLQVNQAAGLNFPLLIRNIGAQNNVEAGSGIGFNNHGASAAPKAAIYNERLVDAIGGKLHFLINNANNNTAVSLADARMTILSGGNVGIGNTSPIARLDVSGGNVALNDGQLRLRAGNDGNHFLSHLGGSFDGPVLQGLSTVVLKTGAHGDASGVFLRNNRVGIGIANPTNGLLHVDGFRDVNFGYQYFNSSASTGWCGSCNSPISIWAQHRIATSELNVFSDARIKDVIGLSDGDEDLHTLLSINVTDYTYKDKIGRGSSIFKKVVAQQIEEVYPIAVSKTTNYIPDIYQLTAIESGMLLLPALEITEGERLKLITENGSEEMVTVESISEKGIQTSSSITGQVFVYGREVHDFRTVDYEAISMLNVSATQELVRQLQAAQAKIESLEKENLMINTKLDDYASVLNRLEQVETQLGIGSSVSAE